MFDFHIYLSDIKALGGHYDLDSDQCESTCGKNTFHASIFLGPKQANVIVKKLKNEQYHILYFSDTPGGFSPDAPDFIDYFDSLRHEPSNSQFNCIYLSRRLIHFTCSLSGLICFFFSLFFLRRLLIYGNLSFSFPFLFLFSIAAILVLLSKNIV